MSILAQVLDFLAPFVLLLAAMIAVQGDTWNSQEVGFKRLTVRGRLTLVLALVACVVCILTFQESRKTELQQAERAAQLRRLAFEKIDRAQRQFVFTFWYLALALHSQTEPIDRTSDTYDLLRSHEVIRGLSTFDLSKPMKMKRMLDRTDPGYQTTWARWMRSNILEASQRLGRVVQVFGQHLDVETSAAVLGVIESEFIASNHELFGDPHLFEHIQRNEETGTTSDARLEGDSASTSGGLGPVGLTRLAGLESNMFGSAVEYRQFIDALQSLAEKIKLRPRPDLAEGRHGDESRSD
jgi:hypothetical protein